MPGMHLAADAQDRDRPSFMERARSKLSGHSTYSDDASMWWGNLVPVAASGWGLLLVAPLLTTYFFLASGARRSE